ncbi:MAG: pyridoxal phosphate-dependent aminotransferase [Candidatus Kapaibacterium sp.]
MSAKDYSAVRIRRIPESIFSTMTRLAFEHKAVNLGQGFPDFDGPEWIMDAAYEAMRSGKNQYAPSPGIFSLRKVLSENEEEFYGLQYDPMTEITITAGATEALFCSIHGLINPGDEVLLFEPFYDSHQADVILAGGIPRYLTLHKPDFSFDTEAIREKITPKTKMMIINTPHNPTGKIFSENELKILAEIAIENDLIVLSDEVYEYLLFDSNKHIPPASLPGMKERTVTISSSGKTFGMTGWKVGFAFAPENLTASIRAVHQWTNFAVNTPAQHAMAEAFSRIKDYLPGFRELYTKKRDLIYSLLRETKFTPHLPSGSYFIMAEVPGEFSDDVDCSTRLVKEYGVAVIPPSAFYAESAEGKSMIRLCFAKDDETIKKGAEILGRI